MSAAKHILLRIWHKRDNEASKPTTATVIWDLERWEPHRLELMEKYGDKVDDMFVVASGGLKRLRLLQKSLSRLDHA
jgi:hypothetical protein